MENDRLNVYQYLPPTMDFSSDTDKLRSHLNRLSSRRIPLQTSDKLGSFPYLFSWKNPTYLFIRKNCVCNIKLCAATFVRKTKKGTRHHCSIRLSVSSAVRLYIHLNSQNIPHCSHRVSAFVTFIAGKVISLNFLQQLKQLLRDISDYHLSLYLAKTLTLL